MLVDILSVFQNNKNGYTDKTDCADKNKKESVFSCDQYRKTPLFSWAFSIGYESKASCVKARRLSLRAAESICMWSG